MKKNKLARAELRRLRRKLDRAERRGEIDNPDVAWCKDQVLRLRDQVCRMELWVDALRRAAAENPEAIREIAAAALRAERP